MVYLMGLNVSLLNYVDKGQQQQSWYEKVWHWCSQAVI